MSSVKGVTWLQAIPTLSFYSATLDFDEQTNSFAQKPRLTMEAACSHDDRTVLLPSGKPLSSLPLTIQAFVGRTPETEAELLSEEIQFSNPHPKGPPFKAHLGWVYSFESERIDISLYLDAVTFGDLAQCIRSPLQHLTHVNLAIFGKGLVQQKSYGQTILHWDGDTTLRIAAIDYRVEAKT